MKKNYYILPILLLSLIYPFLAQYNIVKNPLLGNPNYYQTETLTDIFLQVKAEFLIMIAFIMIVIFAWNKIKNIRTGRLCLSDYKCFLPLGIYALFALLSTIFAKNRTLAISGMPGQFENIWVLLSYLVICIYGYWYIKTTDNNSTLIYVFLSGSLLMGIVFLLQLLGMDPYIAMFASRNATVSVRGVYGGFFNPNYLGSYVNLILPLLITLLSAFRKNKKTAVLLGSTILLTILGLIGSKTTGGVIGIVIVLGFSILFFIFRKLNLSAGKFFISLGGVVLISITLLAGHLAQAAKTDLYLYEPLHAVYTNPTNLEVHRGNYVFYIKTEHTDTNFYVECLDENGDIIPSVIEDGAYHFEDEKYELFSIRPFMIRELGNIVAFELNYGVSTWYFTRDYGDGTYYYITPAGGFTKTTPENTTLGTLFADTPKFMSGRGYIWSQSIPMLEDTLFLGYGPDNYAEQFPNYNFVASLRGGLSNTFISKPHCMYLQMAIQTGLPSLLAFLAFYLIYFARSIQIYLSADLNNKRALVGLGIFLGTLGYLIVGFINDSSITVAPFFWLLLGMGYAMNLRLADAKHS